MVEGPAQEIKSYAETIELVEQKGPNGEIVRVYPLDFILRLRNMGAKILPTRANALHFNTDGLITEEEFKACPEAMGGPTRFIYLNPQFWTDERIKTEHWRFEGIRVLPGKTYIYRNGKIMGPYRLHILDIDSYKAYEKLKELLEGDLFLNTYVTESYKMRDGETFGYHVYWLEDWDDNNDDCVSIRPDDCKAGAEFEIFTGLKYTQIAGHHREHTSFYYHNVGCKNLKDLQFVIHNGLYNKILDLLEGLLLNPEDIVKRRKSQKKHHNPFYAGKDDSDKNYDENFLNTDTHTLTVSQIRFAAFWALEFYGAELDDAVKHYFHFTTAFVSTLVRQNITGKSINYITDLLCDLKPNPKYQKGIWHSWCESCILIRKNGGAILGIPTLLRQVQKSPDYADQESASKYVTELLDHLNLNKITEFNFKKNGANQNKTKYEIFRQKEYERDIKLASEKLSEEDIDFAFKRAVIESPFDKTSIHQLLYGCLSAFTKLPLSHILSSLVPGAGKNHMIRVAIGFIPERYVVPYNRLSDKALFHMSGEMVIRRFDESGKEIIEPVEGYLTSLNNRLRDLRRKSKKSKTSKDVDEIDSIVDEIRGTLEDTQNLIRMDNSIQVFLDTPPEGLWDAYMSLLSQDAERDQFYTFTDRLGVGGNDSSSLGVKTTRLRGAPTIISAGVIDDTSTLRFAEKNRRLIHVNPNTSKDKIETAIQATNDKRLGLPEEYEEDYISDSDRERAKHIFEIIISKIKLHCSQFGFMESGIFIPKIVRKALRNSMNVREGNVWSMTVDDRLSRYFAVITLSRMDNRLRLVDKETGQAWIIPTFDDLKATLNLMNNASSKIRPYVAEFYNTAILPTYDEHPDVNVVTKDGKEIKELVRGITIEQIADHLVKNGMETFDKETIRKRFVEPLSNQGVVNKTKSEIDKRGFILSPVKDYETGISSIFDDDKNPRLTVTDPECYPTPERLRDQFISVSRRSPREKGDTDSSRYEIKNFDQQNFDFADIQPYLGNPDIVFKRGTPLSRSLKNTENLKTPPKDFVPPIGAFWTLKGFEKPQIIPEKNPYLPPDLKDFRRDSPDLKVLERGIETSIHTLKENMKTLTPPKIYNFERYGSFDFEWYRSDLQSNIDAGIAGLIYCAAFVDYLGNTTTLHLEDFNKNYENFIDSVLTEMGKYSALMGFSILERESSLKKKGGGISGDIETLEKNCSVLGPGFEQKLIDVLSNTKILDIYPLFTSEHTKGILSAASKIRLRGDSLDAISTMYLGEGKLQDLSGPEVEPLEPEVQKLYCLQDAILPLKLIQKENFKLLNIFSNLAQECGLDSYRALNHCSTTTFWRGLLKKWQFMRVSTDLTRWQEKEIKRDPKTGSMIKAVNYLGGEVLIPAAVGKFTDILVWDVASMYPTMAIKHNISPETVLCDCCKDNLEAKIADEIMQYINDGLIERNRKDPGKGYAPRPFHYWICIKKRGILPQIMEDLFKKKAEYKKSKMTSEEKGVKIAANSGYGVFAFKFYDGYNIGVAELITGFARYALLGLKREIENLGFSVIYGDTDSLFIKDIRPDAEKTTDNFNQIVELAQSQYKVEFEKDKVFKVFFIPSKQSEILTPSQKQYFGLLDNGEVYATTLVGMKSNYPEYFRNVMLKLIAPEIVEGFYLNGEMGKMRVMEIVREVFVTFDKEISTNLEFIIRNLGRSEDNSKPLFAYPNNGHQRQIFNEILEDCKGDRTLAEQKTRAHIIIPYWRIKLIGKGKNVKSWTCHPNRFDLDKQALKDLLWKRVQPTLDSYLFTKEECKRLKAEVMHM